METVFQEIKQRTLNMLLPYKSLFNIVNHYDSARILLSKRNSKSDIEISHVRFNKDDIGLLINDDGAFTSKDGEFKYVVEAYNCLQNLSDFKEFDAFVETLIKNAKLLIKTSMPDDHKFFDREATIHLTVDQNGNITLSTINFYRVDMENKWYVVKVTEDGIFNTREDKDEPLFKYGGWKALLGYK